MQYWSLALYVIALATTMAGMELFSTVVSLLFLVDAARGGWREWQPVPFYKPLALFVAVSILGIVLGGAPVEAKWHEIGRMRFFLWYAILFQCLVRWDPNLRVLKPLWWTTLVVGLYGVVQHFVAIDLFRPEGRKVLLYAIQAEKIGPLVVGTFNHHLTFASVYFFYASLFAGYALFFFPKEFWRLAHALLLFLLCAWTQSRAAWAAIPVALLGLAATRGRKLVATTVVILVLAGGVFFAVDSGFRERLTRTFDAGNDHYNLGERQRLWRAQWEFFKESPVWGVGYNNNERRAKEVVDRLYPDRKDNFYGHAHSTPLQILATTGAVGTFAYAWLWVSLFAACAAICRRCGRGRPEYWLAVGLAVGFVGFHLQGLTQWNFGDAEVLHNVIFFWAITAALLRKSQTSC